LKLRKKAAFKIPRKNHDDFIMIENHGDFFPPKNHGDSLSLRQPTSMTSS